MDDLERKLADAVAAYVATVDEAGLREAARRLCAVLEFVTGARLKDETSWSPHWWVDGVLDDSIEVTGARALLLRGKLISADERNQWLEPFEARIELGQPPDEALAYRICIGDTERGLRAVPYGSFQRRDSVVREWIFDLRRE